MGSCDKDNAERAASAADSGDIFVAASLFADCFMGMNAGRSKVAFAANAMKKDDPTKGFNIELEVQDVNLPIARLRHAPVNKE